MSFADRDVRIVPEAAGRGRGQQFQVRGHSFSPFYTDRP